MSLADALGAQQLNGMSRTPDGALDPLPVAVADWGALDVGRAIAESGLCGPWSPL